MNNSTVTGAPDAAKSFMTGAEVEDRFGIDLVTAETIRSGLIAITRHMHRTLSRSGFSQVVREMLDFATIIHRFSDDGTEVVAISEGCTHFAFTHAHMANFVTDEWGVDNLGPGDTLICNDPWRGSIHLPDVNLFRPVFWEGEPILLLSDASHLLDIGGAVPGGFHNQAHEVFEEGIRIPPMLITSGDKPVRSTINLILENCRTPMHDLGDLRALFGTMKVGENRLMRLLETYGGQTVRAAAEYTLALGERRMRAAIEKVPDGVYEAEEWIDDDGLGNGPIRMRLTGRVAGSNIELDFTGTDRQPTASTTTCWEETARVLIGAKVILDPRHPFNSGALRPVHVLAPAGTVVMGTPPTSSSQHAEVGSKVSAISVQLFSKMMPGRAVGADGGCTGAFVFAGIDQRPGREGLPFGGIFLVGLGWGGTAEQDGLSFCPSPLWGVSAPVIEMFERDVPVVIRSMNAQIDSSGAGRQRAGYANTLLAEATGELLFSMILDSGRFTRPGTNGGGDGRSSYVFGVSKDEGGWIPQADGLVPLERLTPFGGIFDDEGCPDPVAGKWANGAKYATMKLHNVALTPGETVLVLPACGAGYGDPLERRPELVVRDVANELLSPDAAARMYGVVLDPTSLTVDEAATAEARARLRDERKGEVPLAMPVWPRTTAELGAQRRASNRAATDANVESMA